jgi:hypothetical protein
MGRCGDSIVQAHLGEICDGGLGCSIDCAVQLEYQAYGLSSVRAIVVADDAAHFAGELLAVMSWTDDGSPRLAAADGFVGAPNRGPARIVVQPAGAVGVTLADVSDVTAPVRRGFVLASNARAVAISGDTVFVARGEDGVTVIDASNPSEPEVDATFSFHAEDVAVMGGRLLLAGPTTLSVADLDTDSGLVILSETAMSPRAMVVQGQRAFVVDGSGDADAPDLVTIRITPSDQIQRRATIPLPAAVMPNRIAVALNQLYVTFGHAAPMHVYTVSPVGLPTLTRRFRLGGNAGAIAATQDRIFARIHPDFVLVAAVDPATTQ